MRFLPGDNLPTPDTLQKTKIIINESRPNYGHEKLQTNIVHTNIFKSFEQILLHISLIWKAIGDLCDKRPIFRFNGKRHWVSNRDPLSGDGLTANARRSILRFSCLATRDHRQKISVLLPVRGSLLILGSPGRVTSVHDF